MSDVITLLGQSPINSAVTAGRSAFVSLFRSKTPQYSNTNNDGKNIRAYVNVRGILIEKRYVMSAQTDFNKGYYFQFNPETVKDAHSANYEQRGYSGLPFVDYVWAGGSERNLSFQLFLDNTPQSKTVNFRPDTEALTIEKDVVGVKYANGSAYSSTRVHERGILPEIEKLQSFTYPATVKGEDIPLFASGGVISQNQFRPPAVTIFSYGPMYYEGVVKNVDVEYTLFDADLTPLRATVNVEFAAFEFEDTTKNRFNLKSK